MTDIDQVLTPPPPRRRKASTTTKTTPPPPRRQAVAGGGNGDDQVAVLIRQNQALLERIERLESGGMRTVETTPEPKADVRVADLASLSDFQRSLLDQTFDVPSDFDSRPKKNYNYPLLWYMKQDGTFVQLQGDPANRARYQDKGFRLLNEEETKHFLAVEYPRILREQRQKAHLITTVRKMFEREPTLAGFRNDTDYDGSLNLMSIAQLEDEWEDLRARSVNPNQKLPPLPRFRSDADADAKRMLAGVETNADTSMEAVEAKVGRARRSGRAIEVTGANWNTFR